MWQGWVDLVASVSHLALTISSSLSFYFYIALYGAKHKVGVVISNGRCCYNVELYISFNSIFKFKECLLTAI